MRLMRIRAHTRFRLVKVSYSFGFSEFVVGRKQRIISDRANCQLNPGDVIEDIWEWDGVWIKDIEGEPPKHPLLESMGDGKYRINNAYLMENPDCPIEIEGLMTIEELFPF